MDFSSYGIDGEQLERTVFRELMVRDWMALLKRARLVKVERGRAIIQQGQSPAGLYIVKSGRLRVERQMNGKGILLGRRGPGELLGEMSILEQTQAMASVIADEDAEVYLIESFDLIDLLGEIPGFATRYYRSLAIHLSGRLREAALMMEKMRQQVDAAWQGKDSGIEDAFFIFP